MAGVTRRHVGLLLALAAVLAALLPLLRGLPDPVQGEPGPRASEERLRELRQRLEAETTRAGAVVDSVAVGTALAGGPPAQIRTCSITAYGSHLGLMAERRPKPLHARATPGMTRRSGSVSGAWPYAARSPWPIPFPPRTPPASGLGSPASQVL